MKGLEKGAVNMQRLLLLSSILALMGVAMLGLIFFAVPASRGEIPPPPPDILGKVCYSDDTPVEGATITLNNTNKTDRETQTTTDGNGEWSVNMRATIGAENDDEILITAFVPNSVEKKKNEVLVVDRSNYTQEVKTFVFEKEEESEQPGDGSGSSGGGSGGSSSPTSDELLEGKANATEEEKGAENVSEQQSSPSPSPSPSGIREGEANESAAGEGQSETPSPLKKGEEGEEGAGKSRGISGVQLFYAGIAGLIAIATLFIIRRIRLTGKGGIEKR